MSAGLLGTGDEEPYIKIRHRGTDYFFPLSHDPEGRYLGGGDIQTSTLESFSPSSIAGDPSLVSNELLAVMLWSNFQGGMGTVKYQEQEGTGSLDSFYYSTLNTLYQGMAVLPPGRLSLGTLPRAVTDFRCIVRDMTSTYQIVGFDYDSINPATTRIYALQVNPTTLVATWSDITLTSVAWITDLVMYNNLYVACTNRGIWTSPNGFAWTERWIVPGGATAGLCVHDNKLYCMVGLTLYWTLDPTTTTAWPNQSVDPIKANPGEFVLGLREWKNRQDTRSLFILTNQRIMAWDDDGYWVSFFEANQISGGYGDMTVWPQDKSLYYAPYDNGANVMQFQNQTISNISPNKKGGLIAAMTRSIRRLKGNLNFLFGQGQVPIAVRITGAPVTTPAPNYGQIMAYNGQGWHTLVEGTVSNPVAGMGLGRDQVVLVRNGVNVETIYIPDAPQSLLYINGPVTYAEGTFYLESADADAGLENTYKTARYFELVIENNDGGPSEPGMPSGHTYTFEYVPDGASNWYALATNQGPGQGRIIRIPIATTVWSDARGLPFIKIRWRISFTKGVGTTASVTPILRAVALYYLRANDLIDGIQFQIDLSPDRIKRMVASLGLGDTYVARTPRRLRAILQDIKRSKYNPEITYGPPGSRIVIPAAEIRVSQQENARTALGRYTITARDVSTLTTTVT